MSDTDTRTADRSALATDLGDTVVAALAERDFGRLAGAFASDVRMRALIPAGLVELAGAEAAAARFASWFGDRLELVHSGSDEVGDRLHVFYRLRMKRPGNPWKVIEQHLFCALDAGRITALDLVCSGFRPDAEELTREGTRVGFEGSIHVPEAETFTFDAPSRQEAALVAERAGLDALRVVRALASGEEKP